MFNNNNNKDTLNIHASNCSLNPAFNIQAAYEGKGYACSCRHLEFAGYRHPTIPNFFSEYTVYFRACFLFFNTFPYSSNLFCPTYWIYPTSITRSKCFTKIYRTAVPSLYLTLKNLVKGRCSISIKIKWMNEWANEWMNE